MANIAVWRRRAPWPDDFQVEQDLILSRLMVEIANDELLGPELSFRGGTCLNKLHLPTPARYSEDLDYVRQTKSGIKPYLSALAALATAMGLEEDGTERSGSMVHARFGGTPTSSPGRIRVKIEINVVETDSYLPRLQIPFAVESPWWQGVADIGTFALEELLGTKLRALYQRSKGRDLFDLWHALTRARSRHEQDHRLIPPLHRRAGIQLPRAGPEPSREAQRPGLSGRPDPTGHRPTD